MFRLYVDITWKGMLKLPRVASAEKAKIAAQAKKTLNRLKESIVNKNTNS